MSSDLPISPDLVQRALRGSLPDDQLEQVVTHWRAQPGNLPPDDPLADPLLDAVRDTLTIRDELTRVEADVAPLVERLVRTDLASPLTDSSSDGETSPGLASPDVTYIGPADSPTIDASNAESGDGGARRPVAPLSSAGVTMGTPDPLVTVGPSHDSGSLTASQSTRRDAGLATPVESELVPGLVIGAYKIIRKIGQGGMGMVFLAEHQRMERLVALKVLPPSVTKHLNAVERFHREVKAMARLSHPNIVTAFDADEARGLHILVMEYVDGQDLAALVKKRGPLSVEHAVDYIVQGAKGLEYAHKRGLIHRDIKPSNFLVDTEGLVKILDLGLARFSEQADDGEGPPGMDLTGTGVVVGTVDYMSPEQAEDTKRADARADIYSLGCSLFYLISGRSMFSGDTVVARLMAHQNQPVPSLRSINPAVPEELDRIHRKMVAKKKEERYQTATAMLDDLRKLAPEAFAGQGPRFAPDAARPDNDEQTFVGPLSGSVTGGATAFGALGSVTASSPAGTLTGAGRPRVNKKLLIGAAAAALFVLLGWVIVFRDKEGNKIGEVKGTGPVVAKTANGVTAEVRITDDNSNPGKVAANSPIGSSQGNWNAWPADAPKPAIAPFDAAREKQHQDEWAAYLKVPVEYTNSVGMKFVLIPPGEFTMGSTQEEIDAAIETLGPTSFYDIQDRFRSEAPRHRVVLTKPFFLATRETTQAEYEQLIGNNPSHFSRTSYGKDSVAGADTSSWPVENVSWDEAVAYLEKLVAFEWSARGRMPGQVPPVDPPYRLATEAEWEFAARAGTISQYWTGDGLESLKTAAWYFPHANGKTHPVGTLAANAFGLHDMAGNVWEWTNDRWERDGYSKVTQSPAIDPRGSSVPDAHRVFRGGCWTDQGPGCRSAARCTGSSHTRLHFVGFRAAVSVEEVRSALTGQQQRGDTTKSGWHDWPADAPKPAITPFDAARAKQHQDEWAAYLKVPVEYTNTVGMTFRLIPPGEFTMGSAPEEIAAALKDAGEDKYWQERIKSEAPQHKVILTQPIYLGVNEVTQAEYEKVMGVNPSHFAPMGMDKEAVAGLETAGHPVEMVSWNDAAEFCAKLSQQEKLKPFYFRAGETITPLEGTGYRLPSEAEWEFACRAGTTTKYWIGDKDEDLVRAGWFGRKSGGRTHAAGELQANPFGLYDIHGNVWEWVQDGWDATWYGQFSEKPAVNPSSPFSAVSQRVIRGGYWNITASRCRSPFRDASAPAGRYRGIGFRVSLSVAAVKAALAERAAPLIPDAPVVTPDAANRAGAEWILARGGEVMVIGVNGWITRPDDLPKGSFVVVQASISKRLPDGDSDLVPLRGLFGLTFVGLDGSKATPAAVAGLAGLPKLSRLSFGASTLTDAHIEALLLLRTLEMLHIANSQLTVDGLARLATGLPQVSSLNLLNNPALDDSAVPHLVRFTELMFVELNGTNITARGVEELRRQLPKCRVKWGGTEASWHRWPADAPKPAIAPFNTEQAKNHQEAWAAYLKMPVEYTNSLGLKFRLIPPGEFTMGSTPDEIADGLRGIRASDPHWKEVVNGEAPRHRVILTRPFYLAATEVTQSQYKQITGSNPSHFSAEGKGKQAVEGLDTSNHPVEWMSWVAAVEFCGALSKGEQLAPHASRPGEAELSPDATGYRMPTEAEWEYACRAGGDDAVLGRRFGERP